MRLFFALALIATLPTVTSFRTTLGLRSLASRGVLRKPFVPLMASSSTTSYARAMASAATGTLQDLGARADHSWLRHLAPDPESAAQQPNKTPREVKSGHWVPVLPTPLPQPQLVLYSHATASELGLSDAACESTEFARFFSGDVAAASAESPDKAVDPKAYAAAPLGSEQGLALRSWCTPYALSIMGTPYTNNCPFGTGNGYGDGRAASVGEVVVPASARGPNAQEANGAQDTMIDDPVAYGAAVPTSALANTEGDEATAARRWELQLKGSGTTPFCRGADGRAVLRSSIREFLASEALHALGVPTTRALSLVISEKEGVRRAWYSNQGGMATGMGGETDPDVVRIEQCAISTRVSPSFTRIGHLDLHGRRARKSSAQQESSSSEASPELKALRAMVAHAIFREYPHLLPANVWQKLNEADSSSSSDGGMLMKGEVEDGLNKEVLLAFLDESAVRLASLTANWLRVGFCQGNFNGDNCLVGGRTMDFGPFGFLEAYDPGFAKWVGSGNHFAFMNQPNAGFANWQVLAMSCAPLLVAFGGNQADLTNAVEKAQATFGDALNACWARKLGLHVPPASASSDDEAAAAATASPFGVVDSEVGELFQELEPLLRKSKVDYTMFFRQLAAVVDLVSDSSCGEGGDAKWSPDQSPIIKDDAALVVPLRRSFSAPTSDKVTDAQWANWLRKWLQALAVFQSEEMKDASDDDKKSGAAAAARLRKANPKYIAREWMLVDAYDAAATGDFSKVHRLHALFQTPYDEHTPADEADFYRRNVEAERKSGVAFMT